MNIEELRDSVNIAEQLEDDQLNKIGSQVVAMYELDYLSLADWRDVLDKAMDIAKQTLDQKNEPWENASNIKYPLITRAGIDFASRTYPEFIQNSRVVKASIIGDDPDGAKAERAFRVSTHMSWQLLKQSASWEDSTDRLLHILPLVGTVFRKTYFDPILKQPVSEFCPPESVVVNYKTTSLEEARRITHVLKVDSNRVLERMRNGTYLDMSLDELRTGDGYEAEDDDATLDLLEQHCFLDLDEDDYKEPYIVVVHRATRKVLRIVARFDSIHRNSKKQITCITPQQYFTDYHFIRSPDGGFYSLGLGSLLLPMNAAINTLFNQLIDSGTLNNRQGGFLGRGLRLKNGEFRSQMGTWHVLDAAAGTNLQQNIVPFPTKEPSAVLFQLLGMLIEGGKDLIAANDLMSGKGQTQNVSPSTVLAMIQQGMKIFQGISKRLYNSFTKEFKKIYKLNRDNISQKDYQNALDDPNADVKADYSSEDYDICPIADPAMTSDAERIIKAEAVRNTPGVDPYQASKFYLESLQIDQAKIKVLLPQPDPNAPPPAEVQKDLAQAALFQAQAQELVGRSQVAVASVQLDAKRLEIDAQDSNTKAQVAAATAYSSANAAAINQAKVDLARAKAEHKAQLDELKLIGQSSKDDTAAKLAELDLVQTSILKNKELDIKAKEAEKPADDSTD